MTQLTLYKLINIALLILNAVVVFVPKKPISGMQSNAAGILALLAIIIFGILFIHFVLTVVAVYYNKIIMLKVMTFIIAPFSLALWYFLLPMVRL